MKNENDVSLAAPPSGGPAVRRGVHICSFEACPPVRTKTTYEQFRDGVLLAGRFSVFEATATRRSAKMFDRLCHDPWIDTDNSCGFPWTRVTQRSEPKPEFVEIFACVACGAEFRGNKGPACGHRRACFRRQELIEPTEQGPARRPEADSASNAADLDGAAEGRE